MCVAASFERNSSIIGTRTDGEAAATVSQSFYQNQGGKKRTMHYKCEHVL